MVLTKNYILKNLDKFVLENVTEQQFSQNSIDLSLGEYVFVRVDSCPKNELVKNSFEWNGVEYAKISIKESITLKPGMFALAYTDEWVGAKANTNICWQFLLKSTAARLGLDHNLAGWVETGYFSPLCLELHSHLPIDLKYGDLIGQAVFHTTTQDQIDYSKKGNYQKTNNIEELKKNWKPEDILPKKIKNKMVKND